MLKHLTGRGVLLISGLFNSWNIDVKMVYRIENTNEWRSGLNQFGTKSIITYLEKIGYSCEVQDQIMPFEIPPKEYPVRSWTVDLNQKRHMMCGIQLVYNIQILVITKRK